MIAGHARSKGLILVINYCRECERVPGFGWITGFKLANIGRRITEPRQKLSGYM